MSKAFGLVSPMGVIIGGIIAAGSLAIAVQPVSDEKIHLQDVSGKIQTNVPVSASRAFSPLPIQWSDKNFDDAAMTPDDAVTLATNMVSKQKIVVNFVGDVATRGCIDVFVNNLSDDDQIFILRAGAPSTMALDIDTSNNLACGFSTPTPTVEVQGLVGHNEWLLSVENTPGEDYTVPIIVENTDAGFYPIVFELERVG